MQDRKIPYGRHCVDESDIDAVVEVLRSDWLTTGPKVGEFEQAFALTVGSTHAVALSSGTAALHAAMHVLGIKPGDEVIVPAITFVATANCVVYMGATPVFADVDPDTLLISSDSVERLITPKTRAIIAVDYAGQPCDYDVLAAIAKNYNIFLVADACHSLGGIYKKRPVGVLADLTVFSLHPVKTITTGEGGMVTTNHSEWAADIRRFRNHGIDQDLHQREAVGSWCYDVTELGYNYRLSDIQCALGLSQLKKLQDWVTRRQQIAAMYDDSFSDNRNLAPLKRNSGVEHAFHLYVVKVEGDRAAIYNHLHEAGISVNVHYRPVYLHSFYRERYGMNSGLCPQAEIAYEQILSLPIYPQMIDSDFEFVATALSKAIGK